MGKYPINKEYFPFSHLYPPFPNGEFAGFIGTFMKTPRSIFKDKDIYVTREYADCYNGGKLEIIIYRPKDIEDNCPCLVYFHGGAFVFGASYHHYAMAREYALQTGCVVIFVQYRLSPMYKFPIPAEDCYCGYTWAINNSERLNIDKKRIGVGGDSAGGCLAAAVCLMARDRGDIVPLFQMLIYPVLDRRLKTESQKRFVDTPMWNGKLSVRMWEAYLGKKIKGNICYASPCEASDLSGLSRAYIETAEFDCLCDEGVEYAEMLEKNGVYVVLNETRGTMHGFDAARNKEVPKNAVRARVHFMKEAFDIQ